MARNQGLCLTVIGSADAYNAAGRGHSCYWLEDGAGAAVLIDCGATVLEGIERAGLDPRRLQAVLFTHLHGDHAAGFPFLMLDAIIRSDRREPLTVTGPRGSRQRLEALCSACYPELLDRARGFELEQIELCPGDAADLAGYRVLAHAADHGGAATPALVLELSGDGSRALFTGDTAFSPRLIELARGAELLVADCTDPGPASGRHCSWEDWRPHLDGLARTVVFSHLSAAMRSAIPRLLRDVPGGVELHFADDGLRLQVGADRPPAAD